jgi:hypothetical protein
MMGVYKSTLGCELLETVQLVRMASQEFRSITQSSFPGKPPSYLPVAEPSQLNANLAS